jgi:hypothetical protein
LKRSRTRGKSSESSVQSRLFEGIKLLHDRGNENPFLEPMEHFQATECYGGLRLGKIL